VRDGVEVPFQIRIIDLALPSTQIFANLFQCLVSVAFGPKSVGTILEVSFKDWFHYQQDRTLHHPIPNSRDSQWSQFAVGFGDVDSAHRLASVAFLTHLSPKLLKPWLKALPLDLRKTDPVHSSGSSVSPYLLPGRS
jgi:hypothetical protein